MNQNNSELYKELRDIAESLARPAGTLALEMISSGDLEVETKSSISDLVTAADKAAEELIVSQLKKLRPEDGLKGEEGTSVASKNDITWHIDPIDGTTNFLYGREFGVSLGVCQGNELIAGVVYEPISKTCYSASLGAGAYANDKKLNVSSPESLAHSMIATGFGFDSDTRIRQAKAFAEFIPRIRDLRKIGAASLEFCSVATGQVDGYYEQNLNSWDVAAGLLIAKEAGATITPFNPDMTTADPIVACAPSIFDEVHEVAFKV